ncbi:MAG: 16S rRNA (cytosine(1402)-N(4))-methyltransferase [Actinomycetia bacterium]|nr:16S rRNA (cytosine(1402)-N(4))-methyltransferase [Actinomycetes bacterium]
MADLVCELFKPLRKGTLVDATFGGGGHSLRLRQVMGPKVRIMGIDRDPVVAERAADLGFDFMSGNFADLDRLLDGAGVDPVTGVLFDFGLSSDQLDQPDRGFSYYEDGPAWSQVGCRDCEHLGGGSAGRCHPQIRGGSFRSTDRQGDRGPPSPVRHLGPGRRDR